MKGNIKFLVVLCLYAISAFVVQKYPTTREEKDKLLLTN